MRSSRPLIVVVLTLGLWASACGDDTTADPVVTLADPLAGTADDGAEAPDSAYCGFSRASEVRSATFDAASAPPAETEAFYRDQLELIDEALLVAPESLAADLAIQRSVLVGTIDVLDARGWDLSGAIDELTPLYASEEYQTADGNLAAYDTDVCGIESVEVVPDDSAVAENPGDVPAQFVDYCNVAFGASQADALAPDADAAAAREFYEGLVGRIDELVAVAPTDLEEDLTLIRSNFGQVVSILSGADWDLDVGLPLVDEWAAESPDAAAMDAAIGRVETFDVDVCGIVY